MDLEQKCSMMWVGSVQSIEGLVRTKAVVPEWEGHIQERGLELKQQLFKSLT